MRRDVHHSYGDGFVQTQQVARALATQAHRRIEIARLTHERASARAWAKSGGTNGVRRDTERDAAAAELVAALTAGRLAAAGEADLQALRVQSFELDGPSRAK